MMPWYITLLYWVANLLLYPLHRLLSSLDWWLTRKRIRVREWDKIVTTVLGRLNQAYWLAHNREEAFRKWPHLRKRFEKK